MDCTSPIRTTTTRRDKTRDNIDGSHGHRTHFNIIFCTLRMVKVSVEDKLDGQIAATTLSIEFTFFDGTKKCCGLVDDGARTRNPFCMFRGYSSPVHPFWVWKVYSGSEEELFSNFILFRSIPTGFGWEAELIRNSKRFRAGAWYTTRAFSPTAPGWYNPVWLREQRRTVNVNTIVLIYLLQFHDDDDVEVSSLARSH